MNYCETLEFLMQLKNPKTATSLQRTQGLLSLSGMPQESLKVVHIAGTNGKGSVANMLNSVLCEAGYKTGLFISPYITDIRERIQINGVYISEQKLTEYTSYYKKISESNHIPIGHFDFLTAIAFRFFADEKCDYAVFETGLGGRYDATNVCEKPACCAITSVSEDHTEILGDTLEKIAFEKSGIIKNHVPVVTCRQNEKVQKVILNSAHKLNAPVVVADIADVSDIKTSLFGTSFKYFGKEYTLGLCGIHQAENAAVALEVLKILNIQQQFIIDGLKKSKHIGRLEVLKTNPTVILDGAHNVGGAKALACFLKTISFHGTVIFAAMADKDYAGVLEILFPFASKFVAVNLPLERAAKNTDIAKLNDKILLVEDLDDALSLSHGEDVLITGSLYLVAAARPKLL